MADRSVSVKLRADTGQFKRSIREASREVDQLDRKLRDLRDANLSVRVRLDDSVTRDLRSLQSRLDAWESANGRLSLRVDLDDRVTGDLARLRSELSGLRNVRIPVTAGNEIRSGMAEVAAEIESFRAYAQNRLRIPVTAWEFLDRGLGEAYAEMLAFRQLAERTLRIPVTADRTGLTLPSLGGGAAQGVREAADQFQELGEAGKIALAVLAAFPAISTAAAGAVTLAFGAAFAAMPVMAWKSSDKVQDAWKSLWEDVKAGVREITPAWEAEIAGWTNIIRDVGRSWRPLITDLLEDIRPALTQFFADLGVGLDQLKPMFKDLADGFVAMLAHLGPQMSEVLRVLGDAFGALGRAMQANPQMFGQLLIDLAEVVRLIGQLGQAAVELYPAFSGLFSLIADFNNALQVDVAAGASFLDLLSSIGNAVLYITQPLMALLRGLDLLDQRFGLFGGNAQAATTVLGSALTSAAGDASSGLQGTAASTQELVSVLDLATMSAGDLKTKLEALTSSTFDRRQALRDWEEALDKVTESLNKNGRTLDTTTSQGRANEAALDDLAKKAQKALLAMKEAGASPGELAAEASRYRKVWVEQALLFDTNRREVNKLADELFGLDRLLDGLPQQGVNIAVDANTDPAIDAVREAQASISRSIATMLVRTVVVPPAAGSNSAMPNADGGYYPSIRAFANGAENHVAQIAPAGAWRLWAEPETGGEAYIPLAPSKRARSTAILGKVADQFGMMLVRPTIQSYAAGGITATDIQLGSLLGDWRTVVRPTTAEDLKEAQEARKDRQEQLKEAQERLKEARARRAEEIKEARERLKDAQRERREAAADRKRRIQEARERLKEARQQRKDRLKDARQDVRDAEQDLARARREGKSSSIQAAQRRLRDAKQRLEREERPSSQVRAAERALADAQRDRGLADADRRLREAEERLKEARAASGLKEIADAEKRILAARVDLAEATERLLDVEDRRKFDLMRPTDQLSAALAMGIANTGQFIANLNTLADRGFGNLAQQLLNMGGPEAEKMAADAVTLSDQQLGNLQGQIDTRIKQQQTLSMLPEALPVRSAIRAGKGTSWLALLEATGLSPGTLAKVLKAMPEIASPALLADMAAHGYARGGWIGGIGGPTEDANLIAASKGEFMVNARAARHYGPLLEAINSGTAPKRYAAGGWIGSSPQPSLSHGGDITNNITVIAEQMPPNQLAREIARETAWTLQ